MDTGSEYSTAVSASVLLRMGKLDEARQMVQRTTDNPMWLRGFLTACLDHNTSEMDKIAASAEANLLPERDSELKYYQAAILAHCGERSSAVKFLREAIAENYCAVAALQQDPLLEPVRQSPEFAELRNAASSCQQRFMSGISGP
jgi:hypothetical protein